MEIQSLSDFGHSFQIKLISSLLSDTVFTQQIVDILEPSYFQSEANSTLVTFIKKYFTEYKTPPTLDALKIDIVEMGDEVLKASVIENLREAYRSIESTDLPAIKERTLDFCKNQVLRGAIIDSVSLLEQGNYDEIKTKIDDAMKAGVAPSLGLDYINEITRRYTTAKRHCIPTRWDILNDVMGGGLAAGELGVCVGGPGAGKSWLLQSLGAFAVQQGKTVIHYTMELDEDYTGRRYDSLYTSISSQNLEYHLDEVEARVSKLPGKLYINFFPEQTISVNGLRANLDKYIMRGIKPDLIILDYADCLRPIQVGKRDRSDQLSGDIYSMLKGMAGELKIPIYTASQAGRQSAESEIIEGHQVSDSYIKIMKADFVMSLARKTTDKIAGTGRIHIIKNRFGIDGITFPSKINFTNGSIEMFEKVSVEGQETQKKMDNGNEYARKLLANKFKTMNDNNQ